MKLTEEQIRERLAHPEMLTAFQRWRYRHIDECRKNDSAKYMATKSDPDMNATYLDRKRKGVEKNRDRLNEERREWRKSHKRKYKRIHTLYLDRLHALWRQCPEAYAVHRDAARRRSAMFRRKHGVKREYKHRISMHIPDECSFGNVLNRNSVFLWNNRTAASLLAGREFNRMMWREAHCDRYGYVFR